MGFYKLIMQHITQLVVWILMVARVAAGPAATLAGNHQLQCRHINDKPIPNITLQYPIKGGVDLLDRNNFHV